MMISLKGRGIIINFARKQRTGILIRRCGVKMMVAILNYEKVEHYGVG